MTLAAARILTINGGSSSIKFAFFEFLGIALNASRNAQNAALISPDGARVTVRVIHTDEELVIAQSVRRVLPFTCRNT